MTDAQRQSSSPTGACPKCGKERVDHPECPWCGVVYAKAEVLEVERASIAAQEPEDMYPQEQPAEVDPLSLFDAPTHEDAKLELILRACAIPAVLLLSYAAMSSGGLRMLGKTFMAMWVHELGHASMAWLFGHFAFPGPWVTWHGDSRNALVILMVAAAFVALGLHGARKRNWLVVSVAASLLLLQLVAVAFASRQTAQVWITFFGDAGQLVIGTLLMLTVFSPPGSRFHEGWLRWGFLVIGAVAFTDALHTWLPTMTDYGAIPFGIQSHAGLSDASRLVDNYGWDERALIMRHIRLAQACGLLLAASYVWGIFQSYGQMKSARLHKL